MKNESFEASFPTQIKKIGNSLGVIIPNTIIKGFLLKEKETVFIVIKKIGRDWKMDCNNCDWFQNCELDPEENEDDMVQCYGIRQSLRD